MNHFCMVFFYASLAAYVVIARPDVETLGDEVNVFQPAPPDDLVKQFHYTLGKKTGGERVLSSGNGNYQRSAQEDITVKLTYGPADTISYVDVFASQDSDLSSIYVTEGGVFKNFIGIVLQANRTTFLNYRVVYYGP